MDTSDGFSTDPRRSDAPQGDLARQAVAALRGYAFQLYGSVLAWLVLKEGEDLFLEVTEDYAVLTLRRPSPRPLGFSHRIFRIITRSLLGSVTGRSAFTCSAVTGAAPSPQEPRTKLNTSAISSSESCTRYCGMR